MAICFFAIVAWFMLAHIIKAKQPKFLKNIPDIHRGIIMMVFLLILTSGMLGPVVAAVGFLVWYIVMARGLAAKVA